MKIIFKDIIGTRNYQGTWPKTFGRLLGVSFIRIYQLFGSNFLGTQCRFIPTCSEYSYEAFARHGFLKGIILSLKRVLCCNPCGGHGFDPVPEELSFWQKKAEKKKRN